MAFDGIVISSLVKEFNDKLTGGRINKIYQPEPEELQITVKNGDTFTIFASASPSLPLLYLAGKKKENPITAPNFCMLLRKYLNGARITGVNQPGFERIVDMELEHRDEMGDLCRKHLIMEIMGKYSNIIFTDDSGLILDSIRHVSALVSSVREVLPGRKYVFPPDQGKTDPREADPDTFDRMISTTPGTVSSAICAHFTGISRQIAAELCFEARIDGDTSTAALGQTEIASLWNVFASMMRDIREGHYTPCIVYVNHEPKDYAAVPLTSYQKSDTRFFDSISEVLEYYYGEKNRISNMKQKTSDLRHLVDNAIERTSRKLDLQNKQLKDTKKRDRYRIYGEMIHTYGYQTEPGARSFTCTNYFDGKEITIPLDPDLSISENATRYFNRYNKLKRTYEALTELTKETREELEHLRTVDMSLRLSRDEADIDQIKEELIESGYIKRHGGGRKKKPVKSKPLHYISSDGFDMYVGKNNFQNDELTFKIANAGDYWFHANDIPGSHVIVKKGTAQDLPDSTFEEAARLAAYYSSGRGDSKVEIDYTKRGNLKKPNGAKPGFVIYHTNYSMMAVPDITGIREV